MKFAKLVAVPTTPKSIAELADVDLRKVSDLILQAPTANAAVVNFGTQSAQPGFINAGATAVLEEVSLHNTYIVGTGGDNIIIMVTR